MAAAAAAPAAPKGKRIKVRAIRMGYYDLKRRRENDVFIVDESAFSATWMERVSANTPQQTTGAQAALDAAQQATREDRALRKQAGDGLEEI